MRLVVFLLLSVVGVAAQMPPIEPGVSQELANSRAARYSDVRYKVNLTLEKMSPVLKGTIEIRVTVGTRTLLSATPQGGVPQAIILDWRKIRGSESLSTVSKVSLNGKPADALSPQAAIADKSVRVPFEELNEHLVFRDGVVSGENVIKLDFTSPILTSGAGVTRYIDREDGSEYIYSLFVPSDASTAFPVFDQPDLKARFSLDIACSEGWTVISNSPGRLYQIRDYVVLPGVPTPDLGQTLKFAETPSISTYVFAFAAGPFEQFTNAGDRGGNPSRSEGAPRADSGQGTLPTGRVSASGADGSIFVRRSQADKFRPHAAEVFRLNREGIKFLETYFDYKFPFPKYDIVLIPEFPFGGMEHAGATFLRESAVIFSQEPTKSDHITRANVIFHEAAHQWFGDTVTMKWFDDLWLKEGFAEFMAYKTLEKVMPEANAWKVFYERNKQAAYLTDSTRGTTPIYQRIANLNSAKSAYGNIVYRKAPSFLKQAEFYLGPDKFQTAVRAFLKKHEYANAGWEDLVKEFEVAKGEKLQSWADQWITRRGLPFIRSETFSNGGCLTQYGSGAEKYTWGLMVKTVTENGYDDGHLSTREVVLSPVLPLNRPPTPIEKILGPREGICIQSSHDPESRFFFPNYEDYGYGIFLLDDKSRDYVLKNIHNEKDAFLRSMMWGSLWDSVREAELDPRVYVELAIKNLPTETDETIVSSILSRVGTAMNYYVSVPPVFVETAGRGYPIPPGGTSLTARLEDVLLDRLQKSSTAGLRLTFYRAFVSMASTEKGRTVLKQMLRQGGNPSSSEGALRAESRQGTLPTGRVSASTATMPLRTKDKFDIVTRLAILGDPEAAKLLVELERTETSDDAKRYAYAARAGFATAENKAKYWDDFVNNKTISESWIEAAFGPFNSIRHSDLTLGYLQKALQELPNHKRNRKIFFVNGWLAAFIGGQRSEEALGQVNKFLANNPTLDNDLRLKILENVDLIERAVKIRKKWNH